MTVVEADRWLYSLPQAARTFPGGSNGLMACWVVDAIEAGVKLPTADEVATFDQAQAWLRGLPTEARTFPGGPNGLMASWVLDAAKAGVQLPE